MVVDQYRRQLATALTLLCAGCSKPSTVKTIQSPTPGVYLTFETYDGEGVASSDDMHLYAHFERGGSSATALILDGEELVLKRIEWSDASTLKVCLEGGITNLFRNKVTLDLGRTNFHVRTYLREGCNDD